MKNIKELIAVDIPIIKENIKRDNKEIIQHLNLDKPKAFKALLRRQSNNKGDLTNISLNDAVNLLTLLLYFSKEEENGSLTLKIEEKDIGFSPDNKYTSNAVGYLLANGYIRFKNSSINYELVTPLENNRYSYYPKDCEYQLNTKLYNSLYDNKNKIIDYLKDIIDDCSEISKDEILNQWKKIGYYELLEYLKHMFRKYNFNIKHIGETIKQKLQLILEHFSVSQGFEIIFDAVKNAGAYLPKKGVYPKIMINTIPAYMENCINTRLSKNYDITKSQNDLKLPQSAVSSIFFKRMLKIDTKGFEKKPSIDLLSSKYDEICKNSSKTINNKILKLCNELKLLIDEPNNFYIILELSKTIGTRKNENVRKVHN